MGTDLTAQWGDKLGELVAQAVQSPTPAENAIHARLTGIDSTGIAALVSKLKQDAEGYDGFGLIFQHGTNHQNFQWLQFITRQLVIGSTAKTGNLIFQTNTTSYQLVNSAAEITDFTFASGSKPDNWNTCWKVDSIISSAAPQPFFCYAYEYALSSDKKLTAILDAPSVFTGKPMPTLQSIKNEYKDLPDGLVVMKDQLGTAQGISRAYFSDYLVKKESDKWRILARFDFHVTWNQATRLTNKREFSLRSLETTATTALLECHKAALLRTTTRGEQPYKSFHDSILV